MIIIDYRERKLIDCFQNTHDFQIENLIIGDIIIKKQDTPVLIIERKTISDLEASIKDGRWHEQKLRLLNSQCKILYLIENEKNKQPFPHQKSVILNTLLRDNCPVFLTNDILDTMNTILMLDKKIQTEQFTPLDTPAIQIKKKDVINNNIFLHQLTVIPGISIKTAQEIIKHYKNWQELITECTQHNATNLSNIIISNRRISKKIVSQLIDLLKN